MADRTFSNVSCTAAAMDRGATITSWHPRGEHEALFVTRQANPQKEFHGGIPICAPWFGQGRKGIDVPHAHGLVRWVDWRFEGAKQTPDATVATWTLDAAETVHLAGADHYPSDLQYRYEASFGSELHVALSITSPSQETIVDQAFHNYFLVNAVGQVRVDGVMPESLIVTGYHDEIYPDALTDTITLTMPDRTITITAEGARDVILWNPGPQYAAEMEDFSELDWPRMLCVEVGNVQGNAVIIPAGGTHTMTMTLQLA